MTSGRSLTRICLGYRHWVLCDNVFGGRVLNPPQQFMGYAVESSGCARCDAEFESQPQPKTWWQFWK